MFDSKKLEETRALIAALNRHFPPLEASSRLRVDDSTIGPLGSRLLAAPLDVVLDELLGVLLEDGVDLVEEVVHVLL